MLFPILYDVWPRYREAELQSAWANAMPPMLVLSGRYDPKTPYPIEDELARRFPSATFVSLNNAGHGTLTQVHGTPESVACARRLIGEFLTSPQAPLNRTCRAALIGPDFDAAPPSELSMPSLWP